MLGLQNTEGKQQGFQIWSIMKNFMKNLA